MVVSSMAATAARLIQHLSGMTSSLGVRMERRRHRGPARDQQQEPATMIRERVNAERASTAPLLVFRIRIALL